MDDKGKKFIVGIFEDEDILLNAITTVRDKGLNISEVYSPFPVHGPTINFLPLSSII